MGLGIAEAILFIIIGGIGLVILLTIFVAAASFRTLKQKCIGVGAVICLWLFVGWWKVIHPKNVATEHAMAREEAVAICETEMAAIPSEIPVKSVLIESGAAEVKMLRQLLGSRNLEFVELQRDKGKPGKDGNDRGDVRRARDFPLSGASPDSTIVRLFLSKGPDKACIPDTELSLAFGWKDIPFSPETCLRVEFDQHSKASHALRAISNSQDSKLIQWAVIEQSNNLVLASLTSTDKPRAPVFESAIPDDSDRGEKAKRIYCRAPHFFMLNLLSGPPRTNNDRLALTIRPKVKLAGFDIYVDRNTWKRMPVQEDYLEKCCGTSFNEVRNGPSWQSAFHEAARQGWASFGTGIIDFEAGEIISTQGPHLTRGTKEGFISVERWHETNHIAVVRYSPEGEIIWRRAVFSREDAPESIKQFVPVGMEWDPDELRIYGERIGTPHGERISVWRIPLPIEPDA